MLWATLFGSCGFWTVFCEAKIPTVTQKGDSIFFPLVWQQMPEDESEKNSLMFVCYAYIYSSPLIPHCGPLCMSTLWPCTKKHMHYSNVFPHSLLQKLPVWILLEAVTVQRVTKLCQVIHSTQQRDIASNSAGKPHRWYLRCKTFMEDQWKALTIDPSNSQCLCILITLKAPVFLPCLENQGSATPAEGKKAVCMGRSRSSVGSTPEQQALIMLSPQHAVGSRLY